MMASQSTASFLLRTLREHSTRAYFIEYGGYLSNHLAHGVIALHRLGATENCINGFATLYSKKLEKAKDHGLNSDQPSLNDVDALLGKRQMYYGLYDWYVNLLKNKDKSVGDVIKQAFPGLYKGLIGSALHGLIHLGYGCAAQSEEIICEGLAYLHHSYTPLVLSDKKELHISNFGKGDVSILDVVEEARLNPHLKKTMLEVAARPEWQNLHTSLFQRHTGGLFQVAGDDLITLVHKVQMPEFFNNSSNDLNQILKLADWLIDCAITVYSKSERPNDFFLVHGVTGAWSLRQILPCLEDYNLELEAIRVYMCALFAAYMAQGSPALTVEIDMETASDQVAWKKIITDTLSLARDEHVYKLVQVCHDRWQQNPASGALYAFACKLALENELNFY